MDEINKHLLGLKLIGVNEYDDETHLIFEGNLALIITGSYRQPVYTEVKRRVVTFENIE